MLLLIPACRILTSSPIYGDDHSSHLVTVHHLLALLRGGQTDFFCPTYNLGFPLYLYYQPLPHVTAALTHILSFGLLSETLAFNLTVVALWCLYPVTFYLGARRLGLGDTAALLAGLAAPLVSSSYPFGFALHSYLGLGLYTQLYAMVLFPLGVGWTWHALHRGDGEGPRPVLVAAGLMIAIWLSHAFYGVALATTAVVMTLAVPARLRRSAPRLLIIGALTLGSLLFWLIPLAQSQGFAGGWPWSEAERTQGYGLGGVLRTLLAGKLLDDGRLPLLSLALAGGVLLGLRRLRSPLHRALLLCFGLFLCFLVGRRTFGVLVDVLQPANLGLELFRYIGVVHCFAVLLVGVGLAWLAVRLTAWLKPLAALAVMAALFFPPAAGGLRAATKLFSNIRSYQVSEADLAAFGHAIDQAVRQGHPPGRVYAHGKTGTGVHLVAGLLGLYTGQPMGQSYGVSYHDSLGFYYLEHLDPRDPVGLALYNFRFVLARLDSAFGRARASRGSPPLLRRGELALYALPGDHGYFQPVDLSLALVGRPREIRSASLRWLRSDLPAAGQFGLVVERADAAPAGIGPVLRSRGEAVERREGSSWRPVTTPLAAARATSPGRVLVEHAGLNQYRARVVLSRPAAVALKVAAHPFWEVRVDGEPRQRLVLTPSFLGVQVGQGTHEVSFRFRNPIYQKVLFLLTALLWALLPWVLLPWVQRRWPRRGRDGGAEDRREDPETALVSSPHQARENP